ncbi:mitochondrial fission factor homolog B isoform X2 [Denticeps clupeoides]|uniref:Mitochondrial fission factor n=1 Tax=Denticeps clupeoides TaxID=299321 RepID=A0AAY4CQJ4_9TELE|nr:mitochondrial fission factor isoform X2 [Denticeps clupeoides]
MNGATFPSPTADMAEINRIQYELEYTEGISQRMRIPEQLKVAPYSTDELEDSIHDLPHTAMMQVPERIVVAGESADLQFSRPRDLDLIQSTPVEALSLKTPPRVLTLTERPLEFLEPERSGGQSQPSEEVRSHGRARRERSASENAAVRHNGQLSRNDSSVSPSPLAPVRAVAALTAPDDGPSLYTASGLLSFLQSTTRRAYQHVLEVLDENQRRLALSNMDNSLEILPDDMAIADATALRRQIIKLNRRLQLLEEENKERAKREMVMYSLTVAFWLINTWVWFRR